MQLCAPSSHLRCSTNEDWSIPDLEYRQASANHKDLEFFMRMIKRTFEICLVNSSPFYEKGQVAQDLQMTLLEFHAREQKIQNSNKNHQKMIIHKNKKIVRCTKKAKIQIIENPKIY